MKPDPMAPYFPAFMVTWIALGIGSWVWIRSRPSADEKRFWHRRVTIGAGIVFGIFIAFTLQQWHQPFALLIFLPFLALITFLNLRYTFFCDACGKMSHSQQWFSSTYHCPRCGHKLR
jgi:FtsH-binding integral membrane protein